MSSQFLSLEAAAKRLGVSTERMVELRSQGKIRGFRDGASWKFPENELDRLADELANQSGAYDPYKTFEADVDPDSDEFMAGSNGSGVLVDESKIGSSIGPRGSKIIGGDVKPQSDSGSDVDLGSEAALVRSGSDVNLIAGDSNGSDVKVVTGANLSKNSEDSDDFLLDGGNQGLVEIDSGELQLSANEPAISHDSAVLDLAIEPNAGSTGPVTDKELKEIAKQNPDLMVGKKPAGGGSGIAFDDDDEDSDDDLIGLQDDDDILGADLDLQPSSAEASGVSLDSSRGSAMSSLEMLDDLDMGGSASSGRLSSRSSRGLDVLSELDLLSADAGGSGLITGDSGDVIGSGGLGSKSSKSSNLNFDDALADDDDLVIADDEDDLVLGGGASDVSVSGDSGINLMSPSDSGLSLESEPLDLAGSSISALDLGSEFGSGSGSGSGLSSPAKSGVGSAINFQADEDFRLSPSAIGGGDDDSSQVIEIEDSSAFADADAFGEADPFGDAGPVRDGFAEEAMEADPMAEEAVEEDSFGTPSLSKSRGGRGAPAPVHEVPFSIFQVSMLLVTLLIMCMGGMLMTDLMRNMWAYSETEAPVSSLTDALIDLAQIGS